MWNERCVAARELLRADNWRFTTFLGTDPARFTCFGSNTGADHAALTEALRELVGAA